MASCWVILAAALDPIRFLSYGTAVVTTASTLYYVGSKLRAKGSLKGRPEPCPDLGSTRRQLTFFRRVRPWTTAVAIPNFYRKYSIHTYYIISALEVNPAPTVPWPSGWPGGDDCAAVGCTLSPTHEAHEGRDAGCPARLNYIGSKCYTKSAVGRFTLTVSQPHVDGLGLG